KAGRDIIGGRRADRPVDVEDNRPIGFGRSGRGEEARREQRGGDHTKEAAPPSGCASAMGWSRPHERLLLRQTSSAFAGCVSIVSSPIDGYRLRQDLRP